MKLPLRRRIDNLALRWQARLDSEWADRVLPWLAALGLFIVLALLALARARSLDATVDLAGYAQASWLIGEGREPVMTVTTNAHVLAQQAAFGFYPLAWLTGAGLPIIPTLLVVQSAALASGVLPLWRIARKIANLRPGPSLSLVFVYAFYAVMHNLNLSGFHPETIALPGLLGAMYFGLRNKWRYFVPCCAVVLLMRADLGLAIAGLGVLIALEGKRRQGAVTALAGIGWTAVCILILQPRYGAGSSAHLAAFAAFGDSPGTVLAGFAQQPGTVLGQLVREQNFNLAVTLLAPLLFLPVLVPRYLVPVLPLQFLYLVADVPTDAVFGQQTVAITAFIFLSGAMALGKIGEMGHEKIRVDARVIGALFLAATVFYIRDAASSPYRRPWDWGGQDATDFARIRAADQVKPTDSVRASRTLLILLAEREHLYDLTLGDKPDAARAAEGVDVIVLDDRQVPQWSSVDRQVFRLGLQSLGFRQVSNDEGIELFVRIDTTDR